MDDDIVQIDSLLLSGQERVIRSVDVYVNKRKVGTLKHHDESDSKLNNKGLYEFSYYRPADLLSSEGDYQISVTGAFPIRKQSYFFMDQEAFERADRTYSLNQSERIGLTDKKGEVTLNSESIGKKVSCTLLPSVFFNGIPQGALLKIIMASPDYADLDLNANMLGLLSITGVNPIGRLRFCETGHELSAQRREVRDASSIIEHLDSSDNNSNPMSIVQLLAHYYHKESGISGQMPKFAANIATKALTDVDVQQHIMRSQYSYDRDLSVEFSEDIVIDKNVSGAGVGVIFKTGRADVPASVLNEFVCMSGLKYSGGDCANIKITDKANALVSKRFEMIQDETGMDAGINLGFEELTSIMGRSVSSEGKGFDVPYSKTTIDKETGDVLGIQTGSRSTVTMMDISRAVDKVVSFQNKESAREALFRSFTFSNLVRNGDAHLRNFGILYNEEMSDVWLAPSYDITCTDIYSSIASYNFMGISQPTLHPQSQDMGWMSSSDIDQLARDMGLSRRRKREILEDNKRGIEAAIVAMDEPGPDNANYLSESVNVLLLVTMFRSFEVAIRVFDNDPHYVVPETPHLQTEYEDYLFALTALSDDALIDVHKTMLRYFKSDYLPEVTAVYVDRSLIKDAHNDSWRLPLDLEISAHAKAAFETHQQQQQDNDEFDALMSLIMATDNQDEEGVLKDAASEYPLSDAVDLAIPTCPPPEIKLF